MTGLDLLKPTQRGIEISDLNLFVGKSSPLFRDDEASKFGSWVIPVSMHEPPDCRQERDAHQDDAVIVHCGNGNRERVREAETDVEENDRDDRNSVDRVSGLAHPEGALWEILAPRKQMSSNGQSV